MRRRCHDPQPTWPSLHSQKKGCRSGHLLMVWAASWQGCCDSLPSCSQARAHAQRQRRRQLSEYAPEPDLAAALAATAEAEEAGGKPRLHLVVLGHVDAGKSTLMGRLLHELGCVSNPLLLEIPSCAQSYH